MRFALLALLPAAFGVLIPRRACDTSKVGVPLRNDLAVQAGQRTSLITVGRGFQNYTCTVGKYVSAGAVANLYDVSCIFPVTSHYFNANTTSLMISAATFEGVSFPDTTGLPVLLDHYFITTATGINPVFRDPKSGKEIVGSLRARTDSPNPATVIPWLDLTQVSGDLAKSVYRTHTHGGQPPASCSNEGESLSVDYSAMYFFAK